MKEEKRSLRNAFDDFASSVPWLRESEFSVWSMDGTSEANFDALFKDDWDEKDQIKGAYDSYRKIPLVRNCIKLTAHFTTRNGFETIVEGGDKDKHDAIKKMVDDANRKVNMDYILYQSIIVREIYGASAYHIVPAKETGLPVNLMPLVSSRLKPILDPTTGVLTGYTYTTAKTNESQTLSADKVLLFTLDSLFGDYKGESSVDTLKTTIRRKCNLSMDMLQAAKRCWAPFGVFQITTDKGKSAAQIAEFKKEIKPGMSIVTNKKVEGKIYDMKPDLNGLVRAEEKVDEEIMGNWQMPKALLSREKTMTKSTLEFSLHALYSGPVAGVQLYYKRVLERQWYDVMVDAAGYDSKIYKVKHVWNPMVLADANLIRSLTNAVEKNVLTKKEMFIMLGWQYLDEVDRSTKTPEDVV